MQIWSCNFASGPKSVLYLFLSRIWSCIFTPGPKSVLYLFLFQFWSHMFRKPPTVSPPSILNYNIVLKTLSPFHFSPDYQNESERASLKILKPYILVPNPWILHEMEYKCKKKHKLKQMKWKTYGNCQENHKHMGLSLSFW